MLRLLKTVLIGASVYGLTACTGASFRGEKKSSPKGNENTGAAQETPDDEEGGENPDSGVPAWAGMIDASKIGLAPGEAAPESSAPSTDVSGTNLMLADAPCPAASAGTNAEFLASALCEASKASRRSLYGDREIKRGTKFLSCSSYREGEAGNGWLMDLSCRKIYQDRQTFAEASDESPGTPGSVDRVSLARFQTDLPAVGTWNAAGDFASRYPAQIRFNRTAGAGTPQSFALAIDGSGKVTGYFDGAVGGVTRLGEYTKSLGAGGDACAKSTKGEGCIDQTARFQVRGQGLTRAAIRTLANSDSAGSFSLVEGKLQLDQGGIKDTLGASIPAEFQQVAEIYFRSAQKGAEIWQFVDLRDAQGQPVVDGDGLAERWRGANGAGFCRRLDGQAGACEDLDKDTYGATWRGADTYQPLAPDYTLPATVKIAENPSQAADTPGFGSTTSYSAANFCEVGTPSSLAIATDFTCPATADCDGLTNRKLVGAVFRMTTQKVTWYKGSASACQGTPEPWPIEARGTLQGQMPQVSGPVPQVGIWGEILVVNIGSCSTAGDWTYIVDTAVSTYDTGACVYSKNE